MAYLQKQLITYLSAVQKLQAIPLAGLDPVTQTIIKHRINVRSRQFNEAREQLSVYVRTPRFFPSFSV